jgi:hypothetical protein
VDVDRILSECVRVAAPGALFSHIVDYTDHYRYADSSVAMFHFYRFTEKQWRFWNPSGHFQNRLRHSDFESIFARHGLQLLEVTPCRIEPRRIDFAALAPQFTSYSREDLSTEAGYFVMQRA